MNKFFRFLQHILQGSTEQDQNSTGTQADGQQITLVVDDENIISLMQLLERTKEGKYTCQETLDLLDEYVELAVDNQDVAAIMPLVKNHISYCPDCLERYETLVQIIQNQ